MFAEWLWWLLWLQWQLWVRPRFLQLPGIKQLWWGKYFAFFIALSQYISSAHVIDIHTYWENKCDDLGGQNVLQEISYNKVTVTMYWRWIITIFKMGWEIKSCMQKNSPVWRSFPLAPLSLQDSFWTRTHSHKKKTQCTSLFCLLLFLCVFFLSLSVSCLTTAQVMCRTLL